MNPVRMLFYCTVGAAFGLMIDSASVPVEVLMSLCTAATGWARLCAHWRFMPAAHVLMLAAAALACTLAEHGPGFHTRNVGAHLLCAAAMVAGMSLGTTDLRTHSSVPPFAQVLAGWTLGMAIAAWAADRILRPRSR